MKSAGRKSAAALEIVSANLSGKIMVLKRPSPPEELQFEASVEWERVVGSMPADWFKPETHAMLTQYCRHVVSCRKISAMLETEESSEIVDVKSLERLCRMRDRESRGASMLATRMRITQQTYYDKQKRRGVSSEEKPWD